MAVKLENRGNQSKFPLKTFDLKKLLHINAVLVFKISIVFLTILSLKNNFTNCLLEGLGQPDHHLIKIYLYFGFPE